MVNDLKSSNVDLIKSADEQKQNSGETLKDSAAAVDELCNGFGRYPQSRVTDKRLISKLRKQAPIKKTWTCYPYYIKGEQQDFMYYTDVKYNGAKYRGVYFEKYRPYYTSSGSRENEQRKNGYKSGTVYWFKWEPIKWRVLNVECNVALLHADMILDSQHFDYHCILGKTMFFNNYEYSAIRAWLNDTFLNQAFSDNEKAIILTTAVDNSASTTWTSDNEYACTNTNDKVFLLSCMDVINKDYGFNATKDALDKNRERKVTDYAACQGAYVNTDNGNGWWWLRSPRSDNRHYACGVDYNGDADYFNNVHNASGGVVPALWIKIDDVPVDNSSDVYAFSEDDKTCLFGWYPQSKVTDQKLIDTLNGEAPFNEDTKKKWTCYPYYIKGKQQDFMYYRDIAYKAVQYRGVYFEKYRPYYTGKDSNDNNQQKNGYKSGTVYWFKWEPIKWRVLNVEGNVALLHADMILDSQHFYREWEDRIINGKTVYPNNYEHSDIRAWLNDTFLGKAFSDNEKAIILTTAVNNSASTTWISDNKYVCTNTNDKVFLLSCKDVINKDYRFNTTYNVLDGTRCRKVTDYAACQGAYVNTDNGNGCWWLRSPRSSDDYYACGVGYNGNANYRSYVNFTNGGVVPALKITLNLKRVITIKIDID